MLDDFAQGYIVYADQWAGQREARIVVSVLLNFQLTVDAIVDTGAPWCVLSSQAVGLLGLAHPSGNGSIAAMVIRGVRYRGFVESMTLTLRATDGESLDVEAGVFVPLVGEGEPDLPYNFIGLGGFLNRLRFAVDPERNRFYFGQLGDY